MRNKLLILGRFAHNAHGVLAAVYRLALVGVKRGPEFGFRAIISGLIGVELRTATFTDPKSARCAFYDPKIALVHDCSLAHSIGRL